MSTTIFLFHRPSMNTTEALQMLSCWPDSSTPRPSSNATPNATCTSAKQVDRRKTAERPTASILNFMDGGWQDVVASNEELPQAQAQGMATRKRATENFEPAVQAQAQGMATRKRATENFEPADPLVETPEQVVVLERKRVELSEREKDVLRELFLLRGVPRIHFGPHTFELKAFQNIEFNEIWNKVKTAKGGDVTEAKETLKRCINYLAKSAQVRAAPDEPTSPAARLTPTRKKRTVPLEPPTSARSLDFGTEPVGPAQGLLPHERLKIRETFVVQGQTVLIVKAQVEHYMRTDHNGCAKVLWEVLARKGGDWRKLLDTIRSTCKV
jgi:hypothetical protein